MKKILFAASAALLFPLAHLAQETPSTTVQPPPPTKEQAAFDQKFRFGLRISGQPTWFVSNDKNNIPSGSRFGMGFGLNMEFRFSQTAGLLTGIGGDFEGGHYTFKYQPSDNYEVKYHMSSAGEFLNPKDSKTQTGTTVYVLKDRLIKTTHITIPIILKLSTQEYNGIKYFGLFGGELGFRVRNTANDTYYESRKYTDSSVVITKNESQNDLDISDETSFPMRIGMNVGLGFEYRLGGSTALFMSANFFRSFSNLMQPTSDFAYYNMDSNQPLYLKQNLKQAAVRINVGIMV